jgi:phage terminase large subunit-like protein
MTSSSQPSLPSLPGFPNLTLAQLRALSTEAQRRIESNKLADYKPYPKLKLFHAAGGKFPERLLMAANRVGKTYGGAMEHAMHLTGLYPKWWRGKVFDHPPRMWAASETSEMTVAGVQGALMGRHEVGFGTGSIPLERIVDHRKKQHGVTGAIEFVIVRHGGGGDVQAGYSYCGFKSYDQGRAKFQAETLDAMWFDEEPPSDVYFEGITRISTTNGLCTLTFTPLLGMSAVVTRFIDEQPAGTSITRMEIEDAPHFTPKERRKIIARYPAHEREARTRGIPSMGSGAVYPVMETTISCKRFKIPPHFFRIGGLDFGWDHYSGAIELAFDADNDVTYVTKAHRQKQASPVVFAAAVRPWGQVTPGGAQWLPWAWPHDGQRADGEKFGAQDTKKLAQLYADQGLLMLALHATFEDGTNGVEPGVMDILDRMQSGRWKVFDDLLDWWEEFRRYHRKDGKIVKLNDDLMSAMRYAWMMIRHADQPPVAKRDKPARASNWRTA